MDVTKQAIEKNSPRMNNFEVPRNTEEREKPMAHRSQEAATERSRLWVHFVPATNTTALEPRLVVPLLPVQTQS